MKRVLLMMFFVLAAGFFAADLGAASAQAVKKQPVLAPPKAINQDWQKRWQDTLAAAKKEGEAQIYLNAPSEARIALSDAFYNKFGLKLVVMMGSGGDLEGKLVSEYRAGINQVDVFMPGATSATSVKSQGMLSRIEPMLILPEVADPKSWRDGRLPFFDKDGMIVAYLALKSPSIFYNTDLVKEGEITSYLDLLKPHWKGKIVMYDPTISGSAIAGSHFLTLEWGGNEKVYEYLTSLIKNQECIVTRDMRQQVEWVARGKYAVALWPQSPAISQFLKTGAHLADASIKEKEKITSGNGALGMPTKAPHPNAAIIFLNWFLSREGQTLAVKAIGAGSARIDVPTEGINPMFIPKTWEKYNTETEETTRLKSQFQEGLKKFFAELNK